MEFISYKKALENMKGSYVIHLTHNDLDGYGTEMINNSTTLLSRYDRFFVKDWLSCHFGTPQILSGFIKKTLCPKLMNPEIGTINTSSLPYNTTSMTSALDGSVATYERPEEDTQLKIGMILITDLFPDLEAIHALIDVQETFGIPFFVYDHHKSQESAYDSLICEYGRNIMRQIHLDLSGTWSGSEVYFHSVFIDEDLMGWSHYQPTDKAFMQELAHIISLWDTWQWKNARQSEAQLAKNLNSVFFQVDPARFVAKMCGTSPSELMRSEWALAIKESAAYKQEKDLYTAVHGAIKGRIRSPKGSIDCFYVIAPANCPAGTVSEELFRLNDEIDLCVFIYSNRVSFRSRKDVDCTELSLMYGGGGHPNAGGASALRTRWQFNNGQAIEADFTTK